MAATNYTPIQLYHSTTASAVPLAANLVQGELAINITDGKLYYEDNGGVVQVIATKGAGTIGGSTTQIQYNNAGALAGNAAMTFNSGTSTTTLTTLNLTNALGAIYGGTAQSAYTQGDVLYASATNTLAKLGIGVVNYILTSTGSVPQWVAPTSITVNTATNLAGGLAGSVPYQSAVDATTFLAIGAANRVMTSSGSAPQWVTSLTGLTGVSSSSITNTSLTSGRVVISSTAGLEADSANLTFNGTTLSTTGLSNTGFSTLVKTLTLGDSSFNGAAVFAPATPAKLYLGTGTVTDVTSAASATNTTGAIASLAITPIAATNTSVTYTNASTLYIAGAPSAGTNITITNPYSLYIAAGASYFGGAVDFAVTPSYSGGTANGVMYLNGSKQITTGAVLTFDGTILSSTRFAGALNGTVGATTPTTGAFTTLSATGVTTVQAGTAALPAITTSGDTNTGIFFPAADTIAFAEGGAEAMRITSAGSLLIGATALAFAETFQMYGNYAVFNNASYTGFIGGGTSLGTATASDFAIRSSNALAFLSGGATERMRLTSTGNLGIGTSSPTNTLSVTGSANVTGNVTISGRMGISGRAVQTDELVSIGGTPSSGASQTALNAAVTVTSAATTKARAFAGTVTLPDSVFTCTNVMSVELGNAVKGASATITNQHGLYINDQTQGTNNYGITSLVSSGTNKWNIYASGTAANYFAGNVGIGTTSPSAVGGYNSLTVNGTSGSLVDSFFNGTLTGRIQAYATGYALLAQGAATPLIFGTNNTERMRIDSSGNLLVGVAGTNNGRLDINTGSGTYILDAINVVGGRYFAVDKSAPVNSFILNASGNLGIGTSSPLYPLHVVTTGTTSAAFRNSTAVTAQILVGNTAGDVSLRVLSTGDAFIYSDTGKYLAFGSSGSVERMRLDTSGNLGLGVTPNTGWASGYKVIQNVSTSWFTTNSRDANFGANVYVDAVGYKYIGAAAASLYTQYLGVHSWYRSTSAQVAGTDPVFSQAMTLDASGRLLIGATASFSAAAKLQVQDNISLDTNGTGGKLEIFKYGISVGFFNTPVTAGQLDLSATSVLSFSTSTTERMRLTSTGLGIGTTSPGSKLDIKQSGTNWYDGVKVVRSSADTQRLVLGNTSGASYIASVDAAGGSNNAMLFGRSTDGTTFSESMRLDTSGNVGIGTSSPSATGGQLQVSAAASSATARFDGNANAMSVLNQKGLTLYTNLSGGFVDTTIVAGNTANTYIEFGIHNGTSYTKRLTIDPSGNVLVISVAGLGYGTGSGGTVTQATSRTTGVTLNKPNGAITLVSAAGLATFQSFTVTNSTVAATDVVHVTQKSGTDLYQIFVTATAAGSFRISYATTGGITTEQPVFNFAVIKAVTA